MHKWAISLEVRKDLLRRALVKLGICMCNRKCDDYKLLCDRRLSAGYFAYQQIGGFHGEALLHQLQRAQNVYDDPQYQSAIKQLRSGSNNLETILLNLD